MGINEANVFPFVLYPCIVFKCLGRDKNTIEMQINWYIVHFKVVKQNTNDALEDLKCTNCDDKHISHFDDL